MRCWPIIARELRAQSRQARGHWLRWVGAVSLMAGTFAFLVRRLPPSTTLVFQPDGSMVPLAVKVGALDRWASAFGKFQNDGWPLLAMMNVLVVASIWLVAPFLTADCLSRERRQGTLGILLLTPMRAIDVVLAKWVVHGWQAAWMFLACVPVLIIPVLIGGVGWLDVVYVAGIDVAVLVMALTAGMVASSLWDGPRGVLIGAAVLSAFLAAALSIAWALGISLGGVVVGVAALQQTSLQSELYFSWRQAIRLLGDPQQVWWTLRRTPGPLRLCEAGAGLAGTLLIAIGLLRFVAVRVKRSVLGGTTRVSPRVMEEIAPVAGVSARRRRVLGWIRQRNPFLWIELRTWRGHVVPGLCVGVLFPWEVARSLSGIALSPAEVLGAPVWAFAGILALAATSCFHEERASGSWEFLLTVPRGAVRLLSGKLTGLALQALPAAILVLSIEISLFQGVWGESTSWWISASEYLAVALGLAGRLSLALTLGAYLGLGIRGLLPASLVTLFGIGLAAWLGGKIALGVTGSADFSMGVGTIAVGGAVEMVLSLGCAWATLRALNRRQDCS
ncbi:MAG: hypothetical protein AB7O66_03250 [Limisphaerales bacterium]